MPPFSDILKAIGRTPLAALRVLPAENACGAEIFAKLEAANPGGSIKDRLALAMVDAAEQEGRLVPHSRPRHMIVEATSGNTGIGLALVAAVRGYDLTLTMPESMSEERKTLLRGLGARLLLTPASGGMAGSLDAARRLVAENDGAVMMSQFSNPAGPDVHERTTAVEIWEDLEGRVDVAVAGIGTGGTITGLARGLKARNAALKIFGVEPAESALLSGGGPGPHLIQGIGAGFVPDILDRGLLDGVLAVPGEKALALAKDLMRKEGMFCGISSGAAACAALKLGRDPAFAGKRIVFIAPDSADRYLSTRLFSQ